MFNDNIGYSTKMFLSGFSLFFSKNLNWEFLTKNLVTFKR